MTVGVFTLIRALEDAEGIDIDVDDLEVDLTELNSSLDGLREDLKDPDTNEDLVELIGREDTLQDLLTELQNNVASEVTLDSALTALNSIDDNVAEDFTVEEVRDAVQSLENTTSTETTLSSVDDAIASINNSVATDSTLSDVLAELQSIDDDVASELTLDNVLSELQSIDGKVATDSELIDIRQEIEEIEQKVAQAEDFGSVSNTGSDPDGDVDLTLDTGGRPFAQVYYETEGDAEIVIETSNDESSWRELDRIMTSDEDTDAASDEQFPWLGRRYLRARAEGASGEVVLDIAASR